MDELILYIRTKKLLAILLVTASFLLCFFTFTLQPKYYRFTGLIQLPSTQFDNKNHLILPDVTINQWLQHDAFYWFTNDKDKQLLQSTEISFIGNYLQLSFVLKENNPTLARSFMRLIADNLQQLINKQISLYRLATQLQIQQLMDSKLFFLSIYNTNPKLIWQQIHHIDNTLVKLQQQLRTIDNTVTAIPNLKVQSSQQLLLPTRFSMSILLGISITFLIFCGLYYCNKLRAILDSLHSKKRT